MKHLGISGGGTKIGGLFGVAESIIYDRNYKPDIISGISAGAVLSLPLALDKRMEIKSLIHNIKLSTFFSCSPVKENGGPRIGNLAASILRKKPYLGQQHNLENVLRQFVTEQEFNDYKADDRLPACIVGAVDFYSGKRFFVNLKEVSYTDFPRYVNASASLPVFTEGIRFSKDIRDFEGKGIAADSTQPEVLLWDGGVRDHSPTSKILTSDRFHVTETCTIFSRPDDIRDILIPSEFEAKSILAVLDRFIDITNAEVSKNDDYLEKKIIAEKGIIDHGTFYLPKVMHGVYDVDPDRLKELYDRSKTLVTDDTWKD